jgi:hypothetical protein
MTVNFLDTVVELYDAAVAIHNNHPHGDCDLPQLSTNRSVTVERFYAETNQDGERIQSLQDLWSLTFP